MDDLDSAIEDTFKANDKARAGMTGANPFDDAVDSVISAERVRLRASSRVASAVNPDEAARANALAKQRGLPPDLVQRNLHDVQRLATVDRIDEDTLTAPVLRGRYTDPTFAAVAHDDSKQLSWLEKVVGSFKRGLTGGLQGYDADAVKESADVLNVIDRIQRGELKTDADIAKASRYASIFAGAGRTPDALSAARARAEQVLAENAAEFMARGDKLRASPVPTDYRQFQQAPTFGEALSTFAHSPVSISSQIVSESLGTMTPSLPLIIGGGIAGGAPGLAMASGGTSFVTEYSTALAEIFQQLGVDMRDKQAVLAAVRSPEFVELNRQATVKAGVVGAFDAATAGLAGTKLAKGAVKNVAAQVVVQATGGAAGEALGSVASGQEIKPGAVLAEAFGEVPSALVDVAVVAGRRALQRQTAAKAAVANEQKLQEVAKAADASALKKRDPDTFHEYVQALEPDAVVYLDPQHLVGVDTSAVPGLTTQAAEAMATGGTVAVGLPDLLSHLPGAELAPHIRVEPDALTAAEARQVDPASEIAADVANPPRELLITSPEQAGMTPDRWNEYQAAAAEEAQAAVQERESRSLSDLQWLANRKDEALRAVNKQATAARASIEAEVLVEVRQQPAYAVQQWLKNGTLPDGTASVGAKLSTAALRDMFGDGPAAPWRYLSTNMLAASEGMHPDVVADMFGFESGDAMVRAIVGAEPEAQVVEGMTDQRMLEQHPDIADAIARERSAEAMIAGRAREKFLATEAAALARAVGNKVLLAREARAYAEQSIARRKVRDARPAQFKAAAARAERESAQAFAKGDTALAAKYKQSQVLQVALQNEATAAVAEVAQALRTFKRLAKGNDSARDSNLANTARAILAQYGLAPGDMTPDDYLARLQRYDPDLHADMLALMEGLPAPVADYRDLTVADFRAVRDKVEAVWSLAKSTKEIEVDGKRVQIETAAAGLAQQLAFESPAKREAMVGTNDKLDLRMRLSSMRAALRRVEHWVHARDKGISDGPFRVYIWQPVSEAVTRYRAQRNEYVRRFEALLKPIESTLKPGKIEAPELGDGMHFADRSALLHALLHTGNESNKRKLLLGYQWATERDDGSLDTSRWDAFLNRMISEGRITKRDYDFVQSVWRLLDEMKPAAQKAHKNMFGSYFAEITAEPVQTPFGEYAGGYVPAVTDSLLVPESRTHGAMDDLLAGQNAPLFPAVARGFTKSRTEDYTKPLALDLTMLPAHIDKVARFSTLGPVLRDTARLVVRNKTFTAAMNAVDPTAIESMLMPWLKRVATQTLNKAPESQADRAVAKVANAVRQRTGLLLMAGNVVNTMQQITGLSVALLRVQPRHLAAGMLELVRNPMSTGKAINELSPWMQQRSDSSAKDVDQAIERMLVNPGVLKRAEDFGLKYGYLLQSTAQNFIDRVVWLGAHRQATAAGVSDAQAVRDADAAVRMTQSSFAPEDASKVEHAGAFTRLFLMFYSYFSGQANLIATEAQNADSKARLAVVYLLGFAVPAFVADVIAKGMRGEIGGDDEDGDELAAKLLQSFFMSQARYALAGLPVVGQVGNAVIGQFTRDKFDDRIGASPVYSALEATVRAPRSIYRAFSGEGNPRTAVRDGLTAVQVLTGLPTGPLVRPLGHLADDRKGEVTPRGLVVGR